MYANTTVLELNNYLLFVAHTPLNTKILSVQKKMMLTYYKYFVKIRCAYYFLHKVDFCSKNK